MYSIKLGVNSNGVYYGAGMGIGIENTPGGMQSQVVFVADRFAVMQNINGVPQAMFAIENGQTVIASAFISKLAVQNAVVGAYISSAAVVPSGPYAGLPIMSINFNSGSIEFRGVNYYRADTVNGTFFQNAANGVKFIEMGELS